MGCVAACKFHSTPPQKCNNNTLLYLRSHPLRRRCLLPREKKGIGAKKAQKHPVCQRKIEGGVAKRLANVWRRVNIKKKARAVRGQEIKWEIPDKQVREKGVVRSCHYSGTC